MAQEETVSLSEIFDQILVTPAEGAALVQSWANQFRDSYPNLHTRMHESLQDIATPNAATPAEADSMQPPDRIRSDPNTGRQEVTAREQATEEPPMPELHPASSEKFQQAPVPAPE